MNVLQMALLFHGWKINFAGAVLCTKFGCLCTDMTEGSEMLQIYEAVEINVLYFAFELDFR
jgi:hypothetical protein